MCQNLFFLFFDWKKSRSVDVNITLSPANSQTLKWFYITTSFQWTVSNIFITSFLEIIIELRQNSIFSFDLQYHVFVRFSDDELFRNNNWELKLGVGLLCLSNSHTSLGETNRKYKCKYNVSKILTLVWVRFNLPHQTKFHMHGIQPLFIPLWNIFL